MRRLLTVGTGLVLFLAGLVGTAAASAPAAPQHTSPQVRIASGPAVAPLAPSGCSSGALCFWNGTGYSDGPGKLFGKNPDWSVFGHSSCPSGTWNNCASSAFNNGVNCDSVMWDGKNYTFGAEGILEMDRGVGISNLSNVVFNNVASSNSWITPQHTTNSICTGPNPF